MQDLLLDGAPTPTFCCSGTGLAGTLSASPSVGGGATRDRSFEAPSDLGDDRGGDLLREWGPAIVWDTRARSGKHDETRPRGAFLDKFGTDSCNVNCISEDDSLSILDANRKLGAQEAQELSPPLLASRAHSIGFR